jgi:hypothetical protein
MSTRHQKRSRQVHLLLLGVATLVASGCQQLEPIPDSPIFSTTAVKCAAYWGEECLRTYQSLDPDGVQRTYWDIVPPSLVIQAKPELEPEGSIPVDQPLLTRVVGEVGKAFTRVVRGGFGSSASRFGGAYS